MKTVLIIFGTRPEAIKLAPVILHMRRHSDIRPVVCFTGQHEPEMVDPIFEIFSIQPDEHLSVIEPGQSLAGLTKALIDQLAPVFERIRPSGVLVQGDTTSCLVGALVAFYNQIPIGHVEAGLRTNNLDAPFPEEGNRQLVSRLATLHFAPTLRSAKALYQENISKDSVSITGNTVIDALFEVVRRNESNRINALAKIWPDRRHERPYVLATMHRREVFGEMIRGMLGALSDIAAQHSDIDVVLTSHPNPNVQGAIEDILPEAPSSLKVIPPQPYNLFVDLMKRARLILSDSGGVQEEAPSLDRPVLVLRSQTEREEGVEAGCLVQVGTDRKKIVEKCKRLLTDGDTYRKIALAPNPYGDGKAALRISKAFEEYVMK
ncbi:MAG: UDP-N-acetylglucosamine 2-epimerase (non-hydrolyzing) [Gammaproteobacteria bacterium]|nr:UDP-N-acetylglucosamine 2-epimerase (non-hydrolyzing) [Gammaproteobacteria bacterium]